MSISVGVEPLQVWEIVSGIRGEFHVHVPVLFLFPGKINLGVLIPRTISPGAIY